METEAMVDVVGASEVDQNARYLALDHRSALDLETCSFEASCLEYSICDDLSISVLQEAMTSR